MSDLVNISYGVAGSIGVLGYLIVFFGLFLLMLVVLLLGRIMMHRTRQPRPAASAAADSEPRALQSVSADGEIELYGVNPREAAIVMAIVADHLRKPLEELRFKSIKEVQKP